MSEEVQNAPSELDETNVTVGPFSPFAAVLLKVYDMAAEIEESYEMNKLFVYGIATDLAALDAITGGLQKGHLIIVAGGAGMAKSTLCQNIARLVAKRQDATVALFNLEASDEQAVQRILCADAEVDSLGLVTARLNEDEWGQLAGRVQGLYQARLLMDDRMHKSVEDMWIACDELLKVSKLDLILIDSLPLIGDFAPPSVWDVARLLKLMARRFNVPVVVTTHLYSGRTDRRPDKYPLMGDLAGVESHADEVFLLHRPSPVNTASGVEPLDVIIAKQANGPTGMIRLGFAPHHALITNYDEDDANQATGF